MQDKLIIFDTTLRDGEQSPGASMTKDEKLRIAKALEKMRVDIIEQHGADNLIYGALKGGAQSNGIDTEVCIKTDQTVIPELESNLELGFDVSSAMVFDSQTGERII